MVFFVYPVICLSITPPVYYLPRSWALYCVSVRYSVLRSVALSSIFFNFFFPFFVLCWLQCFLRDAFVLPKSVHCFCSSFPLFVVSARVPLSFMHGSRGVYLWICDGDKCLGVCICNTGFWRRIRVLVGTDLKGFVFSSTYVFSFYLSMCCMYSTRPNPCLSRVPYRVPCPAPCLTPCPLASSVTLCPSDPSCPSRHRYPA
jgi:hypothetical protein